ncbi:AAA family ATPase [Micromonospora sp. 4G57]|uniref:AAA family ATPase n=1 Tax=Micromonospora sicca TaxID=2202420 RepID=A0ABU5JJK3_9ACTN|nr:MULTISPECIES: AAA family ATPase [unclassified Micromonospora]MDZ5446072.1 AAA family ATPase [Micromonospora sp. 4G57]MDZ5492795.1 AAA family ATPase [Micromonospora sp. 4G53]
MTLERKQLDLEDERTAQKRYRRQVQDRASRPITYQGSRNSLWTGTGLPKSAVMPLGALIGRVALREPDEEDLDGGSDFYIGETKANLDGVDVFSWAAPVACTFFRGSRHHELCDEVAVIRAFEHRGDEIVDFHDEPVGDEMPAQPFRKRALTVPAAPSRTLRPPAAPRAAPLPPAPPSPTQSPSAKPTAAQKPAAPTPAAGSTPPVARQRSSLPAPLSPDAAATAPPSARPAPPAVRPEPPASRPAAPAGQSAAAPPVRAEALLRARLAAPRAKSLAPVLATLQPDQYDLVTVPAMDSMIIEGQPGTGKTIIASHRAAYLVSDGTPPENSLDGNVLIVGPTSGYSEHIRAVIDRLTSGSKRVRVLSLPELMRHLLHLRHEPRGPVSRSWQDFAKMLAVLVRAAVARLKATGMMPTLDGVYEHVRRNGSSEYPLTKDPEWIKYLGGLPPVRDARTIRAHTPLLAIIQWEVAKPRDLVGIEHIIVDEAQDVTPLEWHLLTSMNEAHAWTIVGDLNQRRSDYTPGSWTQVLDLLAIPYGDPPIHRLERGYRSTRPILQYANRLLPPAERVVLAFQEEGPEPTVKRCQRSDLGTTVLHHVIRLQVAYPQGTVAVITADPKTVETMLHRARWVRSRQNGSTWQDSGREVTVAHPDTARGLEFDGVVVVEPADFPQNLGRQGPLYTALTRPNRELAVVHTKPLPEPLRRR